MKRSLSCLKGDTIKAIILVCLAVGVVGMSYGSLAMAYGFPLWVPFVLSITVLAGASEFMFIGIVASGGNPLAAAAAGLLVNARHVPFGVTVRELVGKRGLSFLGCHIMNDESVVFGLSQKTPEQRKTFDTLPHHGGPRGRIGHMGHGPMHDKGGPAHAPASATK